MNILLDLLAIGSVLSGILVITSRNPVISVLFLIAVFVNVACYLIVLGINFIGLTYIIIYVGGIAILFLFVLMMLNTKLAELQQIGVEQSRHIPLGFLIGILFLIIIQNFSVVPNGLSSLFNPFDLLNSLLYKFISDFLPWTTSLVKDPYNFKAILWDNSFIRFEQIESLGQLLYGPYMLYLLLCAVILLLAMVGAIHMTYNYKSQ